MMHIMKIHSILIGVLLLLMSGTSFSDATAAYRKCLTKSKTQSIEMWDACYSILDTIDSMNSSGNSWPANLDKNRTYAIYNGLHAAYSLLDSEDRRTWRAFVLMYIVRADEKCGAISPNGTLAATLKRTLTTVETDINSHETLSQRDLKPLIIYVDKMLYRLYEEYFGTNGGYDSLAYAKELNKFVGAVSCGGIEQKRLQEMIIKISDG